MLDKIKIISVNIGERKKIRWRFRTIETGIVKKAVKESIFLGDEDVEGDKVIDRKHHGGKDMAVYAYTKNHYEYFQKLHSKIDFHHGVFGENLTVSNLFETEVYIGDIFQVGEAIIQVSQPRFPCFKLGIVFGTQKIVKQFLNSAYCGFYFRVLQKGFVKKNDEFVLIKKAKNSMSVADVFSIYTKNKGNTAFIQKALNLDFLADKCKISLKKRL
ncbi:MAG TPA: MOSC domain-containing protein [Flavobacteriaceae bacterium]|nr:MOSC domain-containing protein [Flavobacteriaceae bacterium]HIP26105.1 MOSC domain-containing protein [Flavobacteriaceae bacterium]